MTAHDLLDLVSLVLALVAVAANIAAARVAPREWRAQHLVIATLGALYAAGYLVLLVARPDVAEWSNVMRGLGPLAWWLVWVRPALYAGRSWRSTFATLARLSAWPHEHEHATPDARRRAA